jgi:cellobiose-specific phosphotransferase system component IIC
MSKKKTMIHKTAEVANKETEPSIKSGCQDSFRYYWDVVEIPVYILIVISLVVILIQAYELDGITKYLKWVSWIGTVAVFSYIGYVVAEKRKETVRVAAKAGAYAGAISGFVTAIIGILSYYMYPNIYAKSVELAVQQGANPEMIRSFTQIALYAMLVISPLISAFIGMVLAGIVAWFVIKKY